jgi:hypothetical protein
MTRVVRELMDDILTQLAAHFRKLFQGKLTEVGRKLNSLEQGV